MSVPWSLLRIAPRVGQYPAPGLPYGGLRVVDDGGGGRDVDGAGGGVDGAGGDVDG